MMLFNADMRVILPTLEENSIDACCCDPPYHLTTNDRYNATSLDNTNDSNSRRARNPAPADALARLSRGFMGKKWDGGDVAFQVETWRAVYRVLKPGAYLLAFGGTRTAHRMAVAIEDAGFIIRDRIRFEQDASTKYGPLLDSLNDAQRAAVMEMLHEASGGSELAWFYGSGFPKSHAVDKGIDVLLGAERPVIGTQKFSVSALQRTKRVEQGMRPNLTIQNENITGPATDQAERWQGWGTALKPAHEPIIMARKPLIGSVAQNVLQYGTGGINIDACRVEGTGYTKGGQNRTVAFGKPSEKQPRCDGSLGRFPANVVHDRTPEFPHTTTGGRSGNRNSDKFRSVYGKFNGSSVESPIAPSTGSAARFFYSTKADKADRAGSRHPTVKPLDLLGYLTRMVTPPGGTVLDPFAGSGTTLQAALDQGFDVVGIEMEPEYFYDIQARLGIIPSRHYDLFGPLQPWDTL